MLLMKEEDNSEMLSHFYTFFTVPVKKRQNPVVNMIQKIRGGEGGERLYKMYLYCFYNSIVFSIVSCSQCGGILHVS